MTKHYLSICAVIKNEASYLAEWLEFHRLQGVEHFYLYDNGSTDKGWQESYETKGHKLGCFYRDDITGWWCPEWNPVQFKAYNHCLNHFGDESKWIAFIDADEFLISNEADMNVRDSLQDYSGEGVGAVAVNWLIFGSNGHLTKPEGLVIENYTKRQNDLNPHVKSIVRPEFTHSVGANPHYFNFRQGYCAIDENGYDLKGNYALDGKTHEYLQINHYHTKSKAEYFERKSTKPDPGLGVIRSNEWIETSFAAHDRNDVEDLSAAKFAPIIRANLNV